MGFVLKITSGGDAGAEFPFSQDEVKLGRTQDNDVVVKDAASSRSHARVFLKGTRYFVEDLGSANGTEVNGVPISGARALKSGDAIGIGDVVLHFSESERTLVPGRGGDPHQTIESRLGAGRNPAPSQRPGASARVPPPRPADTGDDETAKAPDPEESLDEADADVDVDADADAGAGADVDAEQEPDATGDFEVPPPRALAKARPGLPPAPARASRPVPARSPTVEPEESGMTAAQRARRRRELEQSAGGRVELAWTGLPRPARLVLGTFITLFVLTGVGLAVISIMPKRATKRAEPMELVTNAAPIMESFGAGDTTFHTPDMKTFTFATASPVRVVGVLHYQAAQISKDEVGLSLNGEELGAVPPDGIDTETRELDVVLPAQAIRQHEDNTLVFDNVRNPPESEPWRIWNLWLEILPVPEMSSEEAVRRASDEIEKAAKFYEFRGVGAENLFRAWKTYREAWLLLETMPDRPAELHQIARTRMREIRPLLDQTCSSMLVEYKKAMNLKDPDFARARAILKDIPSRFPSREHPCFNLSKSLLEDLEDVGPPPAGL